MKKVIWLVWLIIVCFVNLSLAENNYPYESVCPVGGDLNDQGYYSKYQKPDPEDPSTWYWSDKWKFAQCNCTSYAAYVLNTYGIPFNNSYRQMNGIFL